MQRTSLPLRLKLTLASLGVFLTLQLALSGAWLVVANKREARAVDTALTGRARAVVQQAALEAGPADPRLAARIREELLQGSAFQRCVVVVRDERGAIVACAPAEGPLAAAALPDPRGRADATLTDVDLPTRAGTERLRAIAFEVAGETGARAWIQVATPPLGALDARPAVLFLLLGLPIGALAAGLMVWIMAGRLMRPIQRMATAARSVSPANLRGRIDVEPGDSEMARLQSEVNAALERMEKGYRAQGQFLSNVSHELKTPIAVILSQAQVLRAGGQAEELGQFAANVEEEMRTLARLVESLLLLARVEHGKELVRQERTSINEVVLEAAERSSELARSLDVPLVTNLHLTGEGESEPELVGDPELLRTMVENLLRNALRFTPRGEPVDLRVVSRQGEASISVRDRGPGIPREHLERIFDRFYQIPGEAGKQRGTGLGLAIARSVAELHKGRIAVRNVPGGGCEFEVRIPLQRIDERAEERATPPTVSDTERHGSPEPRIA